MSFRPEGGIYQESRFLTNARNDNYQVLDCARTDSNKKRHSDRREESIRKVDFSTTLEMTITKFSTTLDLTLIKNVIPTGGRNLSGK